jgi:short-subunit dehydrogenase
MASPKPITLITGASSGIGAALAEIFASHGHELVLVARRKPQLAAIASAIEGRDRPRPHVVAIDLTHADAPERLAFALHERGLAPQYVVNNAGFGLVGLAAQLDRAKQTAMIDLNARVVTDLSLRFVNSLAQFRGGILNVASVAGFMPGPGMAVYHATKAYVLSFSEALHHELAPKSIRVTVLCPGPVKTEFYAQAGMPDDYFPERMTRAAARVARMGYDGLMRGQRLVVPGSDNRLATLLPRLLPRSLMLAIVRASRRSPLS